VASKNEVLLLALAGKMSKNSRNFYDHRHFSKAGGELATAISARHAPAALFLSPKFPEYVNKD
jgi:hypothetical protein